MDICHHALLSIFSEFYDSNFSFVYAVFFCFFITNFKIPFCWWRLYVYTVRGSLIQGSPFILTVLNQFIFIYGDFPYEWWSHIAPLKENFSRR